LKGVFLTQSSEEINDLVLWDSVGIEHHPLDVTHIGVVLKGSSVQADLFAHLGNLLSIILGEQVEFEDSLGNLWSTHDIDLEHSSLEMSFIRSVVLQSLKKESCAFSDFVEFKENTGHVVNVCFGWSLVSVGDHLGKSNSSLWVDWHDLSKNLHKVWYVTSLLAIWHDLVKLVSLNKSLNNLVWRPRLLEDIECHLRVDLSDEITKFISHGELAFLDPVFNKVDLVLGNDWLCKLN
jgi:hypothetical protein